MKEYRQISNISRTLVGKTNVDSEVVGASFVVAVPTSSLFPNNTWLDKLGHGNCKTRQNTYKFWESVRLILTGCR